MQIACADRADCAAPTTNRLCRPRRSNNRSTVPLQQQNDCADCAAPTATTTTTTTTATTTTHRLHRLGARRVASALRPAGMPRARPCPRRRRRHRRCACGASRDPSRREEYKQTVEEETPKRSRPLVVSAEGVSSLPVYLPFSRLPRLVHPLAELATPVVAVVLLVLRVVLVRRVVLSTEKVATCRTGCNTTSETATKDSPTHGAPTCPTCRHFLTRPSLEWSPPLSCVPLLPCPSGLSCAVR